MLKKMGTKPNGVPFHIRNVGLRSTHIARFHTLNALLMTISILPFRILALIQSKPVPLLLKIAFGEEHLGTKNLRIFSINMITKYIKSVLVNLLINWEGCTRLITLKDYITKCFLEGNSKPARSLHLTSSHLTNIQIASISRRLKHIFRCLSLKCQKPFFLLNPVCSSQLHIRASVSSSLTIHRKCHLTSTNPVF